LRLNENWTLVLNWTAEIAFVGVARSRDLGREKNARFTVCSEHFRKDLRYPAPASPSALGPLAASFVLNAMSHTRRSVLTSVPSQWLSEHFDHLEFRLQPFTFRHPIASTCPASA
jgi:hypothetical protein